VSGVAGTAVRLAPRSAWLGGLLILLVAAAVGLQVVRDRAYPRDPIAESVLYVRSPAVMKRLALSFDPLVADVYWIRALQHFGGTRRSADPVKRYELLHPLLTIAVELDPLFNIAYRFGSLFLAEAPPGGPGRPDQAIALLERGLEARPDSWRYMQDIGFIHYWWLHDYRAAADWFNRAADVPGAPWFLRSLAATTLVQGGDRQASRALWRSLLESADDNEWLRTDSARRLEQLDALDRIDELSAAVRRYRAAGGQPPYRWADLQRRGFVWGTPLDPTATPFVLDPLTGRVEVARNSPLWPMPTEPPGGRSP
jgi:tetratricopeptide (TPR) repeat protein